MILHYYFDNDFHALLMLNFSFLDKMDVQDKYSYLTSNKRYCCIYNEFTLQKLHYFFSDSSSCPLLLASSSLLVFIPMSP